MKTRVKFFLYIFLIVISLTYIVHKAYHASKNYKRDTTMLLNQFYKLRTSNPAAAKRTLTIILKQEPNNNIAQRELASWNSRQNIIENSSSAKIKSVILEKPNATKQNDINTSRQIKTRSKTPLPNQSLPPTINHSTELINAGYITLREGHEKKALQYFKRAYWSTHDPRLALQIGYILSQLGDNYNAYWYFYQATNTTDPQIRLNANTAMTNLGGQQTKFIPEPYFVDIYFAPFYYSRFNLAVFPVIARAGITLNKDYGTEVYFSYRRTQDNRSGLIGLLSIPQIYEDNVEILAAGIRTKIFKTFPLEVFSEVGGAYDLINRNRTPWRGDVRAGLVYYNFWGPAPAYSQNYQFTSTLLMDVYSDLIYFSRYNNNLIGSLRIRPGFRIFEFHDFSIDAYVRGYIVYDRNHEFFNNLFEWGPGIAIRPSNRYNLVLRFETIRGYYINVNSFNHFIYS